MLAVLIAGYAAMVTMALPKSVGGGNLLCAAKSCRQAISSSENITSMGSSGVFHPSSVITVKRQAITALMVIARC